MEITTTSRRAGRIGRLLVNVLCTLTVVLALGLILPAAFGLQRYVITGSSMSGTIELGSVVFSEVVPVGELEVGDVITYMPPPESGIDHLVTHRIIEIDGTSFVTQGDAIAQPDPWEFQLTGTDQARVKYDVPHVGWVFLALQDRSLRMLLIGVPAAVIALISLAQLVGALRRRPAPAPVSSARSTGPVAVSRPAVTVAKPTVSVGG